MASDEQLLQPTVYPAYVNTVDKAHIYEAVRQIDDRILHLSRELVKMRKYRDADEQVSVSSRCSFLCRPMANGETKVRCLRQCTNPVVTFERLGDLEKEYPADIQRLRTQPELREVFERHQHGVVREDPSEAEAIADIYAMPVATIALPETSWDAAMDMMQMPQYRRHMEDLVRNWRDRARDYPQEARDELTSKLVRHDGGGVILDTVQNMRA